MRKKIGFLLFFLIITSVSLTVFGQTKNRKTNKKTPKKTVETPAPTTTSVEVPEKANQRPEDTPAKINEAPKKNNPRSEEKSKETQPVYFYEFSQPNFLVRKIYLEHDENGKGKITFEKKDSEESITDPIQISGVSLEKIKGLLQVLNFLDSTEKYQSERSYAHMGVIKIRVKKENKEREVVYDWSENKDARALSDEYRKLADQFIWIFDITVARENQPLEAPKLMDYFDSLIRRNEISDPLQLVPFLRELSNDERIPLIARNRAAKIIKDIEKKAEKK